MAECLASIIIDVYSRVLDDFGKCITKKFLKNSTEEEKESFVKRLKDAQIEKLTKRLQILFNRTSMDHHFIKSYEDIMSQFKSIEQLNIEYEIANNHLQSLENEGSILKRDLDAAIDKLESLCETLLHK